MAVHKHSKLRTYLTTHYPDFSIEKKHTPRLHSLYSDFSNLAFVNKIGYDANVNYWRSIILDCNMRGYLRCPTYTLAIDADTVTESFQLPKLGKPLALECVLSNMVNKGDVITTEDFMRLFPENSSWIMRLYKTIFTSSAQTIPPLAFTMQGEEKRAYVVMPTLKEVSKRIIHSHYSQSANDPSDHLLTFSDFRVLYSTIGDLELTDADLYLLLKYLRSTAGIDVAANVDGYKRTHTVIKFPDKEDSTNVTPARITQIDKSLISIKTTCQALKIQADDLQCESERLVEMAKTHYRNQHKGKATYAEKRRKHIEEILKGRLRSLEAMEMILTKIETSQNDDQLIKTFNFGADTLKSTLATDGLTLEAVHLATQGVQETLSDQKEVEDALTQGIDETLNLELPETEEAELEKALEELEKLTIDKSE
ncbi:hypothetical protein DFQ29_000781, partial [Apophysomyces sp. BC1021]